MSFKTGDHRHDFEVMCPFNSQHKMPYSRLPHHISQGCLAKQKFGHLYKLCPFNSLHYLKSCLYDEHIEKCRSRLKFESSSRHKKTKGQIDDVFEGQFIRKQKINVDSNRLGAVSDVDKCFPEPNFDDLFGGYQNGAVDEDEEIRQEIMMISEMNRAFEDNQQPEYQRIRPADVRIEARSGMSSHIFESSAIISGAESQGRQPQKNSDSSLLEFIAESGRRQDGFIDRSHRQRVRHGRDKNQEYIEHIDSFFRPNHIEISLSRIEFNSQPNKSNTYQRKTENTNSRYQEDEEKSQSRYDAKYSDHNSDRNQDRRSDNYSRNNQYLSRQNENVRRSDNSRNENPYQKKDYDDSREQDGYGYEESDYRVRNHQNRNEKNNKRKTYRNDRDQYRNDDRNQGYHQKDGNRGMRFHAKDNFQTDVSENDQSSFRQDHQEKQDYRYYVDKNAHQKYDVGNYTKSQHQNIQASSSSSQGSKPLRGYKR